MVRDDRVHTEYPPTTGEISGFVDTGAACGATECGATAHGFSVRGPGLLVQGRRSPHRDHVRCVTGAGGARVLAWIGELDRHPRAVQDIADGDESSIPGLNASFALAAWDGRDRCLLLCGDRYGNQPLYYGRTGTRFAFSSRASTVAALLGVRPELDRETLGELIWFGHPVSDRTLFNGVRRLPPATRIRLRDGSETRRAYWRPEFSQGSDRRCEQLEDACSAFARAVERATRDDVALALTGGQDTRAILAAALAHGRRVRGFTAGIAGSLDLGVARRLGRLPGVRSHELELGAEFAVEYPALARELVLLAEGALGMEHAHNIALSRCCRGLFSALVDGGGARVCKRGFLRRAAHGRRAKEDVVDLVVQRCGRPGVAAALLSARATRELEAGIRAKVAALVRENEQEDLAGTLDAYFLRVNWANFYARAAALQSHFIEGRLPFLDYEFLDRAVRLPPALRERSAVQRGVVDRMRPSLRAYGRVFCDVFVPWTGGRFVKYALTGLARAATRIGLPLRPERPCFPFDSWWHGGLSRELARRVEACAGRGLVDARRAGTLARRAGDRDGLSAAELLLRLEFWHEDFVDREVTPPVSSTQESRRPGRAEGTPLAPADFLGFRFG